MFEKFKAKRQLKKRNRIEDWYKQGLQMVQDCHCDALWEFIVDSISYKKAEISYGGFSDCEIIIITEGNCQLESTSFHRVDALLSILNDVYKYKIDSM